MTPTAPATWLGVISAIVGIVAVVLARWLSARDNAASQGARREKAIRKAATDWRNARDEGDDVGMAAAKKRYDYLNAGGKFLALCLCALAGCRTPPAKPIIISEHSMFPPPGFIVPELPDGERRWILLTVPTGVELMLPGDFPQIEDGSMTPGDAN